MRDSKGLRELRERNRQLPQLEALESAREYALRLLDQRDYSRAGIESKLKARGYTEQICEEIAERLVSAELINDQRYAAMLAFDKFNLRGLARRAIALELTQKGIDQADAQLALDQISAEEEADMARLWAEKKLRSTQGAPRESRLRRTVTMLGRKGYPAGLALQVTRELLAAEESALAEE